MTIYMYNMYIVLSSCYVVMKYARNLNYVLNQNVNVTKRERFATFAISIVDNLCLLMKQHK